MTYSNSSKRERDDVLKIQQLQKPHKHSKADKEKVKKA